MVCPSRILTCLVTASNRPSVCKPCQMSKSNYCVSFTDKQMECKDCSHAGIFPSASLHSTFVVDTWVRVSVVYVCMYLCVCVFCFTCLNNSLNEWLQLRQRTLYSCELVRKHVQFQSQKKATSVYITVHKTHQVRFFFFFCTFLFISVGLLLPLQQCLWQSIKVQKCFRDLLRTTLSLGIFASVLAEMFLT